MKIYLHIGTEKTGTTSIQAFLTKNREKLLEHKILYPQSLGLPNNINLAIALQNEDKIDDLRVRARILTKKEIYDFTRKISVELTAEINEKSPDILIVSSEHLSSRLNKVEEIQRLYEFLKTFSDDIEVLIYLRRQDSFYESLYSTAIKAGNVMEFKFPDHARHDFHYLAMLRKWETSFGVENMKVRVFDKKHLHNSDVLQDFINLYQLPINYSKNENKNENISFGRKKISFLKEFNKYIPEIKNEKINPFRGDIVKILDEIEIEDESVKLDYKVRLEILSRFQKGNNKIAEEYFDNKKELFEALKTSNDVIGMDLTAEEAIEISVKIWTKKEKTLREQKNTIMYLECELLLEKKLFDKAKKKIIEYEIIFPNHARKHYLNARLAYLSDNIKLAISEIKKAVELAPYNDDFRRLSLLIKQKQSKEIL